MPQSLTRREKLLHSSCCKFDGRTNGHDGVCPDLTRLHRSADLELDAIQSVPRTPQAFPDRVFIRVGCMAVRMIHQTKDLRPWPEAAILPAVMVTSMMHIQLPKDCHTMVVVWGPRGNSGIKG